MYVAAPCGRAGPHPVRLAHICEQSKASVRYRTDMYGTTKSIDRVDYRVVRPSRKVDSQQRSEPMTTLDISEIPRSMGQFGRSLENLVRPAESFSRKSGGCSGGCRCGGGCGGSCGCSGGVAATDRGPGAYENGWGAVTGVRGEVPLHRVVETGRVSVPEAITANRNIGADTVPRAEAVGVPWTLRSTPNVQFRLHVPRRWGSRRVDRGRCDRG